MNTYHPSTTPVSFALQRTSSFSVIKGPHNKNPNTEMQLVG